MLGRLLSRSAPVEERASWSLSQFSDVTGYLAALSSTTVGVDQAVTHSATSACMDVLASSVSALPLDAVRYQGLTRVPVTPNPQLVSSPSGLVELDVWLYQTIDSMLTDGNTFGLVTKSDRLGWPQQVDLLDPNKVTDRKVVDGVRQAEVDGTTMQVYPYGDLVHIPGKLVRAGSPFGQSPLRRAGETISAAIAARRFGRQFFDAGGQPVAGFFTEQDVTPEQARDTKQAFLRATQNREPFVRGSGWQYEQYSVNPNDSQFIESMRFAIEEACRFFRVPPSMVYAATSGQNVTYANVSQADLHYLKHSLDGYLVRIERALTALLPRPQVVKFNRSALLRADAENRHKVYDIRLRNKTMTVDEVRALEDEEPFGGDSAQPGIPGGPVTPPTPPTPPEPPARSVRKSVTHDELGRIAEIVEVTE